MHVSVHSYYLLLLTLIKDETKAEHILHVYILYLSANTIFKVDGLCDKNFINNF